MFQLNQKLIKFVLILKNVFGPIVNSQYGENKLTNKKKVCNKFVIVQSNSRNSFGLKF